MSLSTVLFIGLLTWRLKDTKLDNAFRRCNTTMKVILRAIRVKCCRDSEAAPLCTQFRKSTITESTQLVMTRVLAVDGLHADVHRGRTQTYKSQKMLSSMANNPDTLPERIMHKPSVLNWPEHGEIECLNACGCR